MIFLLLFTLGILAVPLAWDIARHGRDNILQRSWSELLDFLRHRRSLRDLLPHGDVQGSSVQFANGLAVYASSFIIIAIVLVLGGLIARPEFAAFLGSLFNRYGFNN